LVKRLLLVFLCLLFVACSRVEKQSAFPIKVIPESVSKKLAEKKREREAEIVSVSEKEKEPAKPLLQWKGGGSSKTVGGKGRAGRKTHQVSMSFDTVEIYQVVTTILHDVMNVNCVVEGKLNTTVSLSIKGAFSDDELLDFLRVLLESVGYTLMKNGRVFFVKPAKTLPQPSIRTGFSWWFYKPKYVSAKELASVFGRLQSKEGIVFVVGGALLVSDTPDRVKDFKALAQLMDVDAFRGYDFRIYSLAYSTPSEVQKELDELMKSVGFKPGENYSAIPIDRLGYLLVVSSSASVGDRIASLLKVLDSSSGSGEKRVYIYRVQHVEAKELAETLKSFLTGKGVVKSSGKKEKEKSPPVVKGNVVIVPDEVTNTLLIEATPRDYERVRKIIQALDAMPRQVLIDVLIAEVSLDKEFEYGIEWWLKVHGNTYSAEVANTFGLAGSKDKLIGFRYYDINPNNFWNFLYFLTTNSKVNVLSSPHILVRDNEKAKIDVGKEVPVLTLETVGNTQIQGTSAIDRRVEYRNVGVILEVKPHISQEGVVTLEVSQEISSPEPNTVSGIDSPIISKRKVTTTLIVKDGHTVVIGGIIDTHKEKIHKSVPLLGDIPYLGNLFSYERTSERRTELIVMITPHVVNSSSEADVITSVFQTRLKRLLGGKSKK